MGFIKDNYNIEQTSPVNTDAYHFTTSYAYWLEGRADNRSVSYMFGRREALNGGYTVAAGLEGVIDVVNRWQEHGFTDQDIKFLRSQKTPSGKQKFPEAFIDYLQEMEFKLKIDAAPEGSLFFPQEPILRVEGPIAQVKMLESVALCLLNGHSAYATHAARQSDVIEEKLDNNSPTGTASIQGLRRGPGLGAAIEASRSLGLAGYTSTSTGVAAKATGQVFAGTMDHAWVMTHKRELGDKTLVELLQLQNDGKIHEFRESLVDDAFRSFALARPESGILLVDTYDPLQGLENAIIVIKELHELGLGKGYGIRFDSGDITEYSKIALRRFAEEGFVEGVEPKDVANMTHEDLLKHADKSIVFCAAADGITEHSAKEMRARGAFFKSWGIGTGGSHVAPLGLVYKAASVYMDVLENPDVDMPVTEMTPVMKVASNAPVKSSNPGIINSRRCYDEAGTLSHVIIYDETLGLNQKGDAINLRDFSDTQSFDAKDIKKGQDLLTPVFDADGKYVYQEPAMRESFTGSGHMVTDLSAVTQKIKAQLNSLPKNVRAVLRPRDEILQNKLLKVFKEASSKGQNLFSLNITDIEASLPEEVGHIPVYLDKNLFDQRMECEEKHSKQSNHTGVAEYHERFETGTGDTGKAVNNNKKIQNNRKFGR